MSMRHLPAVLTRHQQPAAGGQAAQQRGQREHREADEEHPAAGDEVAQPTGEQQQATEGDQVGVDHPGEVGLREVQVALDGGERHVHDRRIDDHHQLAEADDEERDPAALRRCKCTSDSHYAMDYIKCDDRHASRYYG